MNAAKFGWVLVSKAGSWGGWFRPRRVHADFKKNPVAIIELWVL